MKKKKLLGLILVLTLLFLFTACTKTEGEQDIVKEPSINEETEVENDLVMKSGTYTATTNGYGGELTVELKIADNKIESINIPASNETANVGGRAIKMMAADMLEMQTPSVDAVTGATLSSFAFLGAVRDCITQSGVDPSAITGNIIEEEKTESSVVYDTDVVVVGGGLSGVTSAVSASENGADVILLEKASFLGGNSQMSLGSFMVAEVETNEGHHITEEEDTLEAAMERWHKKMDDGNNLYPDYDRVEFFINQSMFNITWLKDHGVKFAPKTPIADRGMAMVQGDVDGGDPDATPSGRIIDHLAEIAEGTGVEILLNTAAYELITEGEKVVGLKAKNKGTEIIINASNVILASGGFAGNQELAKELIPDLPESFSQTTVTNTGDGILMAKKVGAALFEDYWIHPAWPGPTNEFYKANPYTKIIIEASSTLDFSESTYDRLMVDKDGNRFMNEAQPYGNQVVKMVEYKSDPYWVLYDQLRPEAMKIIESGLKTNTVFRADKIEDLAKQANIDATTLQATVDRYNEMANKGLDEDFGKLPERMSAIGEEGPYYLVQVIPGSVDTFGGVKTNYDQQVLNTEGEVIEGLYAVGAMSNRHLYHRNYFSGSQLTNAAMSGQIAGEKIGESLE